MIAIKVNLRTLQHIAPHQQDTQDVDAWSMLGGNHDDLYVFNAAGEQISHLGATDYDVRTETGYNQVRNAVVLASESKCERSSGVGSEGLSTLMVIGIALFCWGFVVVYQLRKRYFRTLGQADISPALFRLDKHLNREDMSTGFVELSQDDDDPGVNDEELQQDEHTVGVELSTVSPLTASVVDDELQEEECQTVG